MAADVGIVFFTSPLAGEVDRSGTKSGSGRVRGRTAAISLVPLTRLAASPLATLSREGRGKRTSDRRP